MTGLGALNLQVKEFASTGNGKQGWQAGMCKHWKQQVTMSGWNLQVI